MMGEEPVKFSFTLVGDKSRRESFEKRLNAVREKMMDTVDDLELLSRVLAFWLDKQSVSQKVFN